MYKNRIARELSLYFAIALLIFSVIIGSVFIILFKNHTIELHKVELVERATSIANTLSGYLSGEKGMGGYGAYVRFMGDIAGTDVWVVDEDFNLITAGMGHGMKMHNYQYSELPPDAERVVQEVFEDQIVFSQGFSEVLSESTLTVGAPIKNQENKVIGVVLLHSPVHGTDRSIKEGFTVLTVSLMIALIIAFLFSIGFSIKFTKPLAKMKDTAMELAEGNYSIKNHIELDNEIGQLAIAIDTLSERLEEASRQSEKLEHMRNEFVANISHELRTPVTVVRGSLEALVDQVVTDPIQVEEYHKQMLLETMSLQRLIGDLLELSRLQNLDFKIEKQEVSIGDLLSDITRSIGPLAREKNITIQLIAPDRGLSIYGDYGRLRQMIMIVIDNGVKFSPQGSILEVTLENNILSIRDQGIGIPKEDIPYIFDRFYKSRSEHNKTGTGLGLAIAKQIADRHDIRLTVQSVEGKGSIFRFEI